MPCNPSELCQSCRPIRPSLPSVARTKPGLRVTLVQVFMRRHMRPIHLWEGEISPQLLAKHPALQDVLGLGEHLYPFKESTDQTRVAPFMLTGTDPFA